MRANHSTPRMGPRIGAVRVLPRRLMPSSRPVDDDVDEIVRRYRAEILEYEPVAELLVQPAHGVVDLDPVPPVDQEGGVYHHAVAHDLARSRLVDEGSDAIENGLLVARAFLRQGVLHLLADADALVVGFRRRTPDERIAHPTNRLVVPRHLRNRGAVVPECLETELHPVAHLLEQLGELLVACREEPLLDRVRIRRNRAEAHRQQVELLHDFLEHQRVRHHVPATVLVFDIGRAAHDRADSPIIDKVHGIAAFADAAREEFPRFGADDDRVDVLSIGRLGVFHRSSSCDAQRRLSTMFERHSDARPPSQILRARICSTPLLYFFFMLLPSMAPGSRTSLAYRRSPCDEMAKTASRCSIVISSSRAPGSSAVTTISVPSSNTSTSGSRTSSATTPSVAAWILRNGSTLSAPAPPRPVRMLSP